MKVRGDGRSYLLNISTEGSFDILWNDIYHYLLFTRGGPYWQIVKVNISFTRNVICCNYAYKYIFLLQIPFSKFVLGSKGRMQDKQGRVPLTKISHFGIASGDKINGSFSLEIEYIGLY